MLSVNSDIDINNDDGTSMHNNIVNQPTVERAHNEKTLLIYTQTYTPCTPPSLSKS
jgi:hypothetical protein